MSYLSFRKKKCIKKTHRIIEYCISPNLSCCAAFTFCGSWLNAHPKRMIRNPSWGRGFASWVGLGWSVVLQVNEDGRVAHLYPHIDICHRSSHCGRAYPLRFLPLMGQSQQTRLDKLLFIIVTNETNMRRRRRGKIRGASLQLTAPFQLRRAIGTSPVLEARFRY